MSQSNEPSMEEILSSIKRIIAEDSDSLAPRGGTPVAEPEREGDPDVLELTEPFGGLEAPAEPESQSEAIAVEEAPALAKAPVAPKSESVGPSFDTSADALLSATTEAATRHALASLSRMLVKPEDPAADNTLEGLVREMLRPMLKEWLDAHLPGIVQATVDREVARISGRG
jgi:cell pole-organizing protein PopZ